MSSDTQPIPDRRPGLAARIKAARRPRTVTVIRDWKREEDFFALVKRLNVCERDDPRLSDCGVCGHLAPSTVEFHIGVRTGRRAARRIAHQVVDALMPASSDQW